MLKRSTLLVVGVFSLVIGVFAGRMPASAAQYATFGDVTVRYSYNAGEGLVTGNATLYYNSQSNESAGYDFINEENTNVSGGALYVVYENGKVKFYANNEGQGGIVQLKALGSKMPKVRVGLYNRMGVEVKPRATYAVYDELNDVYVKVYIVRMSKVSTVPTASTSQVSTPVVSTNPVVSVPNTNTNNYYVPVGSSNVPTIISPSQNQNFTNYPRTLSASWTPVTGAEHYEIQIDCDICGSAPWESSYHYTTTNNATTYNAFSPLAGDQEFRMKIRAINYYGISGPWSNYTYFYFKNTYFKNHDGLPAPTITYPAQNQTLNGLTQLSLAWTAVYPNPIKYKMQFECASDCNNSSWQKVAEYMTPDNMLSYSNFTLPNNGEYRVRVQAVEKSGFEIGGYWSPYVYFTYTSGSSYAPSTAPTQLNYTLDYRAQAANLSWQRDTKVNSYNLLVECNGCGANSDWATYMNASIDPTASYYISSDPGRTEVRIGMSENKQYRFRVKSDSRVDGAAGVWSDYMYINYNKPTVLGSATLNILQESARVNTAGLTVSWTPVTSAMQYWVTVYCTDNSCQERNIGTDKTTLTDIYTNPGHPYRVFVRAEDYNFQFIAQSNVATVLQ